MCISLADFELRLRIIATLLGVRTNEETWRRGRRRSDVKEIKNIEKITIEKNESGQKTGKEELEKKIEMIGKGKIENKENENVRREQSMKRNDYLASMKTITRPRYLEEMPLDHLFAPVPNHLKYLLKRRTLFLCRVTLLHLRLIPQSPPPQLLLFPQYLTPHSPTLFLHHLPHMDPL